MEAKVAKIKSADDVRLARVANEHISFKGFNPLLLGWRELGKVGLRAVRKWLRVDIETDSLLRFIKFNPLTAEREGAAKVLAHNRWFALVEVAIHEAHESSVLTRRLDGAGVCFVFVERRGASCGHSATFSTVLRLNSDPSNGPPEVSHTFNR